MKEQGGILQLRSHIRRFYTHDIDGPQCIEMSMISTDCVMHVIAHTKGLAT
jgi:hypothetical protein